MSVTGLRLHGDADAAFLAAHRIDPAALRPFKAGDLVVVCAACDTPMLAETWIELGGAHCGQQSTSPHLPPVDAESPPVIHAGRGTEDEASVAPIGVPGVASSGRRGFFPIATLAAVVLVGALVILWQSTDRSAASAQGGRVAADLLAEPVTPTAEPRPTTAPPQQSAPPPPDPAHDSPEYDNIAIVNSPGDGFLALRSDPTVQSGTRLAQMPDGAEIGLLGICDYPDVIDGKEGRWCLAEYQGQRGWAFTAYLIIPPTG